MSYNPATDFPALLRQIGNGVESTRMPGLDYVLAALARMNFVTLYVGQSAPNVNQSTTAWLRPALPSWTAEGVVFLWDAIAQQYKAATPDLWAALFSRAVTGYSFQSAASAANVVLPGTSLLAIQRNAPATTTIILPDVVAQGNKPLRIVDWSSNVVSHVITVQRAGNSTIMQRQTFALLSTADQAAGVTLQPSPELNGWVIA